VEITAEHKQKFLKIKEAYDVLSDPKRRKLYDQLGVSGLKLMENPKEVDPMQILQNYQVPAFWGVQNWMCSFF
jgi:DnaJ-class molecular chaperone